MICIPICLPKHVWLDPLSTIITPTLDSTPGYQRVTVCHREAAKQRQQHHICGRGSGSGVAMDPPPVWGHVGTDWIHTSYHILHTGRYKKSLISDDLVIYKVCCHVLPQACVCIKLMKVQGNDISSISPILYFSLVQAIYGWRGANPENMEAQFENDFKGCETVFLNCNYRYVGSLIHTITCLIFICTTVLALISLPPYVPFLPDLSLPS